MRYWKPRLGWCARADASSSSLSILSKIEKLKRVSENWPEPGGERLSLKNPWSPVSGKSGRTRRREAPSFGRWKSQHTNRTWAGASLPHISRRGRNESHGDTGHIFQTERCDRGARGACNRC